jgi:3-hydroxyisobutyrate dehydrogenase
VSDETTQADATPTGTMPSVGFIGLGNVGGKLAGSLLRNNIALTVRDLDRTAA